MPLERWQQIDELFHAAAERPAHERAAFLAEACADEEVRREVESLLAADSAAEEMETAKLPVQVAVEMLDKSSARLTSGQMLDQYRILSQLGAGGLGEVFLAEDTRLHRKVALKLLPAQFSNDPDRVRRFEQEAHAVSALNHPNIITLFDLGRAGSCTCQMNSSDTFAKSAGRNCAAFYLGTIVVPVANEPSTKCRVTLNSWPDFVKLSGASK